jgi:hypothetical protein
MFKMNIKYFIIILSLVIPLNFCFSADYYCGQDGYADRVIVRDDGSGNALWIVDASTSSAFGDGQGDMSGTFGLISDYHMLGDVNGDGYTDRIVARVHATGSYLWWQVSYSGPNGFGTSGVNDEGSFGGSNMIPYAVADIDGDGKEDCVVLGYNVDGDPSTPDPRRYYVKYSDDGFVSGDVENSFFGGTNTDLAGVADVNGDGIDDRVDYFSGAGWRADFAPPGGGFGDATSDYTGYYAGDVLRFTADVNGDGYADRVYSQLNGAGTYYNWNASLTTSSSWGTSGTDYTQVTTFGEPGDELLIADVVTQEVPYELQYLEPYSDSYGTNGLWHFDEIIEESGGKLITPDDDSENPRNHDMVLYSGTTMATYLTGPQLVSDPIGDPGSGDPNFGNCLYFAGTGQNLWADTLLGDDLDVDDSNLRVEAWAKYEGSVLGQGDDYFIACHHQRFRLRLLDHDSLGFLLHAWIFDSNVVAHALKYSIPTEYINEWNHVALTFYNGTASLYFNGELVDSISVPTETINPSTTPRVTLGAAMYGGSPESYFWGKIDEVRIGQAVPTSPECGYWGYSPADLNKDCYVNTVDLKMFVEQWLDCTVPGDMSCIPW